MYIYTLTRVFFLSPPPFTTTTTATSSAHLEDLAYLDEQRHTPLRTSLRMPRQSTTCGPGRSGQDLRGEQQGRVKEHTHTHLHTLLLPLMSTSSGEVLQTLRLCAELYLRRTRLCVCDSHLHVAQYNMSVHQIRRRDGKITRHQNTFHSMNSVANHQDACTSSDDVCNSVVVLCIAPCRKPVSLKWAEEQCGCGTADNCSCEKVLKA